MRVNVGFVLISGGVDNEGRGEIPVVQHSACWNVKNL